MKNLIKHIKYNRPNSGKDFVENILEKMVLVKQSKFNHLNVYAIDGDIILVENLIYNECLQLEYILNTKYFCKIIGSNWRSVSGAIMRIVKEHYEYKMVDEKIIVREFDEFYDSNFSWETQYKLSTYTKLLKKNKYQKSISFIRNIYEKLIK